MPDPLSADVVDRLKSDPTAALAAALILTGSFPDLVSWAVRVFDPRDPKPGGSNGELNANGAGGSNGVANRHGAKKAARANGHHSSREGAAKHDEGAVGAECGPDPDAGVTRDHPHERPAAQFRRCCRSSGEKARLRVRTPRPGQMDRYRS